MSEVFEYMKPKRIGKATLAFELGYDNVNYFFRKVSESPIYNELLRCGYTKNQKELTSKQMEIICEYFGYPILNEK